MRAVSAGLRLLACYALLPSGGETVRVPSRHPRQPGIEMPAFVKDPRRAPDVPARLGRRIDRYSALAFRAVSTLVGPLEMPVPERVGVFLANTRAGWAYADEQFDSMIRNGPRLVAPYFVTAWFPAAGIGEVTIGLSYRGPAKTTTGRLSGVGEALWLARDALEREAVDVAIVGAVDCLVSPFVLLDWASEQDLPVTGHAEGAVVFAIAREPSTGRDRQAPGLAELRDLRYVDTRRATAWDQDWLPTLSIAAELARRAVDAAALESGIDLALGGGYHVTLSKPPA